MAIDMLTASYRTNLEGIVSEADLQEALAYMEEKGSYIEVRGLALAIMVEDKMFLPSTAMTSNLLLATYLARPIKVDYGRIVSDEFKLSPAQRGNIQSFAENTTPIDISMTTKNPRQMEKDLVTSMDRMGFRGRNNLIRAYQAGDIGSKIIETH